MNNEHLTRFADDLHEHAGLDVDFAPDPKPDGLHVLSINGTDFFFFADGSGYDGWGRALIESEGE